MTSLLYSMTKIHFSYCSSFLILYNGWNIAENKLECQLQLSVMNILDAFSRTIFLKMHLVLFFPLMWCWFTSDD